MDYEKKYNEALKRAKAAIDIAANKDLVKGVASTIFPELRESEDERTRKELLDYVKYNKEHTPETDTYTKKLVDMAKYIDAEKLKSIIKVQIKERKEWMKDIDRSDRQDQLWSDLNGEDISILQIINSLQQEQPEVNLETEINEIWNSRFSLSWGDNSLLSINHKRFEAIARHFYNLGLNARKEE